MAWKKPIYYFSNVVTPSPYFLLTSEQQLEPAHTVVTQKCGGGVVLRHGLVVSRNGQHELTMG